MWLSPDKVKRRSDQAPGEVCITCQPAPGSLPSTWDNGRHFEASNRLTSFLSATCRHPNFAPTNLKWMHLFASAPAANRLSAHLLWFTIHPSGSVMSREWRLTLTPPFQTSLWQRRPAEALLLYLMYCASLIPILNFIDLKMLQIT